MIPFLRLLCVLDELILFVNDDVFVVFGIALSIENSFVAYNFHTIERLFKHVDLLLELSIFNLQFIRFLINFLLFIFIHLLVKFLQLLLIVQLRTRTLRGNIHHVLLVTLLKGLIKLYFFKFCIS